MIRKLNSVVVIMATSNSPFTAVALLAAVTAWQQASQEFYRMKKVLSAAFLMLAMASTGSALYAQAPQDAPPAGTPAEHRMPPSPEQRLQHMTRMLNLTSDQQEKIKPILENESQQMQALHNDTATPHEQKRAKMRDIRQNTMSQITPILTAEQQQKWEQMRQRHMEGRGPGAAGAGTPPPAATTQPPAPPQQ